MDSYIDTLSDTIVNYSLKLKKREKVLITYQSSECNPLVKKLILKINTIESIPFVRLIDNSVTSLLLEGTTEPRIKEIRKQNKFDVDNFDAFISIRYTTNDYEQKLVPSCVREKIGEATKDIDDIKINQRKWVLLNYPSALDAFKAKMPIDKFKEHALAIMNLDYAKMAEDIKPLKKLMEKTDKVRITGKGTDITFSIKDIPIVSCCGTHNLPDGEVFTAPVKDSVNGVITYNTPSPYQGNIYYNVTLEFKDGKIISATADNDVEQLTKIFDTDEGSKYIGEFAIGLNSLILEPIGDILYDEKIIGSIHFTPGRAYKDAYNGNESSIHWDMVLIQRAEYGGGNIYFDDVLIRENGLFVPSDLKHLNYHLK